MQFVDFDSEVVSNLLHLTINQSIRRPSVHSYGLPSQLAEGFCSTLMNVFNATVAAVTVIAAVISAVVFAIVITDANVLAVQLRAYRQILTNGLELLASVVVRAARFPLRFQRRDR